ncbi:hydrogenase maturation protease [Myxococcota bacterium]|nr:hydrogenase maturation protease [Myxococcota bacterium]
MSSHANFHAPIAVLGLGNTLLGDDAAGPRIIQELLRCWELPSRVEALDLGTPGLDLSPYLHGREAVLFVDTIDLDAPPGTVVQLERDALLAGDLPPRVSPHDPALRESVHLVELVSERPLDAALVAVVPAHHELGSPMSPPVSDALAPATDAVIRWLRARGLEPIARSDVAERRTS